MVETRTSEKKLPDDIVFQIIERLPTKSLVKFKALSTRFCSIIDELLRARGSEDDQGGGDFQTELDLLEDVQTPSVSDEERVFNLLTSLVDDALHVIFGKLSVRSLVRVGCVCKRFKHVTTNHLRPLQKRIFLPWEPFHSLSLGDYSMVEHITPAGRVDAYVYRDYECERPNIPRRDDAYMFPEYVVAGSMNKGTLVVVEVTSSPHHVMLVNPLLNLYSVIPPPPPHINGDDGRNTYCYGVGWDNNTSQMFIVQLQKMFQDFYGVGAGCLFSLKENCWARLAFKGSLYIEQYAGTYHEASGCLFWIAKGGLEESVILRFNIAQRVFSTVEIKGEPLDCLGTINGELCALTRFSPQELYQVRVLQLGQSGENWVNTHSIENLHGPSRSKFPMLLAVSDEGGLLLLNKDEKGKYLTCYSIQKGLLEEVKSPMSVEYIYERQGMEYEESTTLPSYYFPFYKSLVTLKKEDIKGKRVLLRCDLNVWLDKTSITDDIDLSDDDILDGDIFSDDNDNMPIYTALPTIKYLLSYGARLIIASHLGSPKGVTAELSLKPLVPILKELLGSEVKMADDCIGPRVDELVGEIPEGGVLMLENLRFHREEENNDPEFAMKLASLAELYVNDAFAIAHKAHASTEGIAHHLRPCVSGFLMQKEVDYLVGALSSPKKPFAVVVGGSKVGSKMDVIDSLLSKVDVLIIGGTLAFTFFKAKGFAVGSSLVGEEDKVRAADTILEKAASLGVCVLLPSDVVIASPDGHTKKRSEDRNPRRVIMATAAAGSRVFKYSTMTIAQDGFKLKVAGGEFADSEIIVLLGQHGTGKTTFIRLLRGFPVPDTVQGPYIKYYSAYKAQTMLRPYPIKVSKLLREDIDDATLDPLFVTQVMEPLQIDHLMDRMVSSLSREETQRLSLCLCLGKRAHIYLIDEPSAHLTPQQRDVAARVIKRFVTLFNKTAFVVEHDFTMVEHLADKVVVFQGTPSVDCVANAPQPWDLFLGGTHSHMFWE